MTNLIQQSKLKNELLDGEFLRATQAQIAKDFTQVNSIFKDSFEDSVSNVNDLNDQVSSSLTKQLESGQRETLQLMYRIDIPEQKFLELTTQPDFIDQLSEQIIYREAYKVWLRRNFS